MFIAGLFQECPEDLICCWQQASLSGPEKVKQGWIWRVVQGIATNKSQGYGRDSCRKNILENKLIENHFHSVTRKQHGYIYINTKITTFPLSYSAYPEIGAKRFSGVYLHLLAKIAALNAIFQCLRGPS